MKFKTCFLWGRGLRLVLMAALFKRGKSKEVKEVKPKSILIADQNYRCNVCIEEISKGDYMVQCDCAQVFHVECSKTVEICPKCGGSLRTLAMNALYTCPKCAKPIAKDEWVWRCSCDVKYHLPCARRVDSCIRCQRDIDWVDGKRMKIIPQAKTVIQMNVNTCAHCGSEIENAERYTCICGSIYHRGCADGLKECIDCNTPMLEGKDILENTPNCSAEKR